MERKNWTKRKSEPAQEQKNRPLKIQEKIINFYMRNNLCFASAALWFLFNKKRIQFSVRLRLKRWRQSDYLAHTVSMCWYRIVLASHTFARRLFCLSMSFQKGEQHFTYEKTSPTRKIREKNPKRKVKSRKKSPKKKKRREEWREKRKLQREHTRECKI